MATKLDWLLLIFFDYFDYLFETNNPMIFNKQSLGLS